MLRTLLPFCRLAAKEIHIGGARGGRLVSTPQSSLSLSHTHTLPGTSSIRTQRVYPVGFQPNPVGFLELKPIWVCFSFFYNLKKTNLGLVFFLPLCLQLL